MKLKVFGAAALAAVLIMTGALPASAATQNWTSPVNVSAADEVKFASQIVAAPDGTLTVIWASTDGNAHVIQSSSSFDQGASWSAPLNVSVVGQAASSPQLVSALDGTLTAVWFRSDGSNRIIQSSVSTDMGVSWFAPVDVSDAGQDAFDPQLVVAPDGTLTALWQRSDGFHRIIQSSSSTDNGVSWSGPVDVSDAGQDAGSPQVVTGTDGTLTAVWHRFNGSHNIIQSSRSTDKGVSWSAPADLSVPGQYAQYPQIAVASDDSLTAVWERSNGSHLIIQSSTSTDNGVSWSAPVDVSLAGFNAMEAQIVAAPDNTLSAVWYRADGSHYLVQSSSSTDQGVSWSTPIDLSAAGQNAISPQIAVAPDGTLMAVWHRSNGSNDIVQSSGSRDQGASWTTPVDLSVAGQDSLVPQIVAAPDGLFTAVWFRYESNITSVIQSSLGEMAPQATGPELAAAGSDLTVPATFAALLLLMLGGALLATSRAKARRSESPSPAQHG